jgi:putative FmdB family regulatory protein
MECEQHFEELVRMDADAPACPHCGGLNARRQLSVFAVHGASSQPSYGQTAAGGGGCCGGSCGCGH